jgi:hypothetical protein
MVARLGDVRDDRNPSDGGGPGFGLIANKFATASWDGGSFRLGASTTRGTSEPPRAILIV